MDATQLDALLVIFDHHERTSCSEEEPRNWHTTAGRQNYPRCTRCALLRMQKDPEFLEQSSIRSVDILWVPYA